MQAFCQHEVQPEGFPPQLDEFLADEADFLEGRVPARKAQDYARGLVCDVRTHLDTIDASLQTASKHWDVARMARVDRNILRVAVCELLHRPDVPATVVMDEAIEIARQFGDADSPAFVNGVLDAVRKRIVSQQGGDPAPACGPANDDRPSASAAEKAIHPAESALPASDQDGRCDGTL